MASERATIQKILKDPRVESVSDERNCDDGYWVYFKTGWNNGDGGEHALHEDNPQECLNKFGLIAKCDCDSDCRAVHAVISK